MKKIKKLVLTLIAAFVCALTLSGLGSSSTAQAAEKLSSYKKIQEGDTKTVNGNTFSLDYSYSKQCFKLRIKYSSGKTKTISGIQSNQVVTNGKYVYYCTGKYAGQSGAGAPVYSKRKICRFTVSSKKTKTIKTISGTDNAYAMVGCDGTYLYIGTQSQYTGGYWEMSILNLKSGQISYTGVNEVGTIKPIGSRLMVYGTTSNFPHGGNLYLMRKDGSGVVQLNDKESNSRISTVKIKGSYIYFTELQFDWSQRKCKCRKDGTGKKILSGWSGSVAR